MDCAPKIHEPSALMIVDESALPQESRIAKPHYHKILTWAIGLGIVAACVLGSINLVSGKSTLSTGGFLPDYGYAQLASQDLQSTFKVGPPNVLIDLRVDSGADSEAAKRIARNVTDAIGKFVLKPSILSYWSTTPSLPTLRSGDGRGGLITALIPGGPNEVARVVPRLRAAVDSVVPPTAKVNMGGQAIVVDAISARAQEDLLHAEAIVIPVTFVTLLWVFGSVSLALIPVLSAAATGFVAFGIVGLLASQMEVSVYALNIVSALALGLSIDYSLLLVSRYHAASRSGMSGPEAVATAMSSARHIIFTAASLMSLCMACLLIVNLQFQRSIALAGICVVVAAAIVSLVIAPILLRWCGALEARTKVRRVNLSEPGFVSSFLVRTALARPIVATALSTGLLVILITPFFSVNFAPLDDRALTTSSGAYKESTEIRKDYPDFSNEPLYLLAKNSADLSAAISDIRNGAFGSDLDTITANSISIGGRDFPSTFGALKSVTGQQAGILLPGSSFTPARLMDLGRSVKRAASDHNTVVSGTYIDQLDEQHAIFSRFPAVICLLTIAVFLAVFALTRGAVVAIKTVVLGYASLAAAFGAVVWIFQEGHLASLLGFKATGSVDAIGPVLLLILALGLSLDYQIILLGRVAEEYRKSGDTASAIRISVDRTARILAPAALLVSVVFVAIGMSGVTLVKIIGVGLALALIVDSIVIRMVLVPALMTLLGRYNWWPNIDAPRKTLSR